jgi:hypothetical protein
MIIKFIEHIAERILIYKFKIDHDGGILVWICSQIIFLIFLAIFLAILVNYYHYLIGSSLVQLPKEEIPILVNNEFDLKNQKITFEFQPETKKKIVYGSVATVVIISVCVGVAWCYGFDLNFLLVC